MDAQDQSVNKALFNGLVMMFSASAMQQLGKLVDPSTGKSQVNLEAAQMTIDMLNMLKAKTKGNLDHEEESLLSNALSTAQMNYVETAAAPGSKAPAESEPPASPEEPSEKPADKKDPKYRKSYGA